MQIKTRDVNKWIKMQMILVLILLRGHQFIQSEPLLLDSVHTKAQANIIILVHNLDLRLNI